MNNLNILHIIKDNQEIPDFYKMKIYYITGTVEEFDVAQHNLIDKILWIEDKQIKGWEALSSPYFRFVTRDDIWNEIPISSIRRIEYDKNYSKLIALREKEAKKEEIKNG